MEVFLIIMLVVVAAQCIATGFLPALFPIGAAIYYLATSKNAGTSIDSFFALCFFGGIIAFIVDAVR